ncbi:MAG: RluA family pseudouridine synthase [Candidatus Andersenbacteria bacterium]|nr:RluA family pseudouridine synthase [Candidatus Andersenbacteria bacterium]MBI3250707.1 RluA family pseudouridine synthase [Candidatus Andersenbacteria bacterium]
MPELLTVSKEESGQRLDVWCAAHFPQYSRAALQRAIKAGGIMLNGVVVKPKQTLRVDDTITVNIVPPENTEPAPDSSSLKIPIIYEDKDMLAINKPAGISVHPAPAERGPTISAWFAARYPRSAEVGDPGRPGIVHRLDKDTSGVLLLAKTAEAYTRLKEQFKRHRPRKEYLALVFGIPGEKFGRITRPIGRSKRNPHRRMVIPAGTSDDLLEGKPAITEWKLKETFGNDFSLFQVYIFTGRTHQIRVHMHFLGHPVVGDTLYTFKRQRPPEGVTHQFLHAERIAFQLPSGKKKIIEAELPEDLQQVLTHLRKTRS